MKVLTTNRRASFDYQLGDRLVAGVVLAGHEVKSLKAGNASLKGSFITLKNQEAYLMGAHITPYTLAQAKATIDPTRQRKLLLHRRQLAQLQAAKETGSSLVPTAFLLDGRHVKLELAVAAGKKHYDKRNTLKARDTLREMARDIAKFSRQ